MSNLFQVQIVRLKKIVNERGFLMEVQRADDPHFSGFGQAYITQTLPGVVKAWYRHQIQTDQITIVSGQVYLVLVDSRHTSPTYREIQKIILTDQEPVLVQIPAGVWHGFKAMGAQPACLLHINSEPFNAQEPDEERLPADTTYIDYSWDPE